MRFWFSLPLVIVVFLSGCGGAVDTGPAPEGGYSTTKVKYEDPLAHVPKTDIEVGEYAVTEEADPLRLEKVISARNTEVFTFRGQIRGQPKIVRTHQVLVECTRESASGTVMTGGGGGTCQLEGDLAVFAIHVRSPQESGRHRVAIKAYRGLRDDGTMLSQKELDLMAPLVIAEGEIDVRADDQKPTPVTDTPSSKR